MTKLDQDGLDDADGAKPDPVTPAPSSTDDSAGMSFATRRAPLAEREIWFKTYWRPAAAWAYLFINLFDFVVAPVMSMLLPKFITGATYAPWTSLTLSNGGLFHLAFGAIIGVTAWGRTREKVSGVSSDG